MFKFLAFLFVLILILMSCQGSISTSPLHYENDIPVWLKLKIDSISTQSYYWGTSVHRCEWRGSYVYYLDIPVSSCMFCEVFDQYGEKINLQDAELFQDFLTNKRNDIIIWSWPMG